MGAPIPEGLIPPECPPELEYLMSWFEELNAQRQGGMAGPQAIPYSEIQAWAFTTQRSLSRFETRLLVALDALLRGTLHKIKENEREST